MKKELQDLESTLKVLLEDLSTREERLESVKETLHQLAVQKQAALEAVSLRFVCDCTSFVSTEIICDIVLPAARGVQKEGPVVGDCLEKLGQLP